MKKLNRIILCMVLFAMILSVAASADFGPKPSVHVDFTGMENKTYYVTLLSLYDSNGPTSAYDGTNARYKETDKEYPVWKAFTEYKDADGYYFLQQFSSLHEGNSEYVWGYYPPYTFKVLVYYPDTNEFSVSGICERYAFDSYFTVSGVSAGESGFETAKSYDYVPEIIGFFTRFLITLAIETLVAVPFMLIKKKQLLALLMVNFITQLILNIALNVIAHFDGSLLFMFYYILFEVIIVVIEAAAYSVLLHREKFGRVAVWRSILYAVVSNVASFFTGMLCAYLIK